MACSGRTDITLVSPDNPLGLDRNEDVGNDDIITTNRMNLPVGKPVVIFLSSKDVIHSFGLPQMRVKQDAIPGIVQPVWFTPTQVGQWDIACSQLCGLGHFRMKGVYAIQTQEAYDAWLKDEAEFLLSAILYREVRMDAEDAHPSRRSLLKTGLAAAGAAAIGVTADADAKASALRAGAEQSQSPALVSAAGFVDGSRAAAVVAAPLSRTSRCDRSVDGRSSFAPEATNLCYSNTGAVLGLGPNFRRTSQHDGAHSGSRRRRRR
jgi:hypothetical protein